MRKRNNFRTVSWASGIIKNPDAITTAELKTFKVLAQQPNEHLQSYSFCGSSAKIYKQEDELQTSDISLSGKNTVIWLEWMIAMVDRVQEPHQPSLCDSPKDVEPANNQPPAPAMPRPPTSPFSFQYSPAPTPYPFSTQTSCTPSPNPSPNASTHISSSSTVIPLTPTDPHPQPQEIKFFRMRKQHEQHQKENDKTTTDMHRQSTALNIEGKFTFGYKGEKLVIVRPAKKKQNQKIIAVDYSCDDAKEHKVNASMDIEKVKAERRRETNCWMPGQGRFQGILKQFKQELNNAVNRSRDMRVLVDLASGERQRDRGYVTSGCTTFKTIRSQNRIKSTKKFIILDEFEA